MHTPAYALRAKIFGQLELPAQPVEAPETRLASDLRLFLITYAAGFAAVMLFIA